jgi:hypothetical protein
MNRSLATILWLSLVIFAGLDRPPKASGQATAGRSRGGSLPRIELEGRLAAWQGNMLRVIADDGRSLVFAMPAKPNAIRFQASLKDQRLSQGMLVRIEAPAAAGQFLEPIKSLEVVFPDPNARNPKSSLAERSLSTPGIYPLSQLYPPSPGKMANPSVRIVGSVVGQQEQKLVLQCGPKTLTIELAPDVSMEVKAPHLRFAATGDRVRASGQFDPSNQQFVASSLEVIAAKPLFDPSSRAAPSAVTKLGIKASTKSGKKEDAAATDLPTPAPAMPVPADPPETSEMPKFPGLGEPLNSPSP